jgi:hypothetical protein
VRQSARGKAELSVNIRGVSDNEDDGNTEDDHTTTAENEEGDELDEEDEEDEQEKRRPRNIYIDDSAQEARCASYVRLKLAH